MAEKKENNKSVKTKDFDKYFGLCKKYFFKILELDLEIYFFIVPSILLLIAFLTIATPYYGILRIYLCLSSAILAYKFYETDSAYNDKIFAMIFGGIAIIYFPLLPLSFGEGKPIIFILTLALYVLGYKKIKDK